MKSRYPPFEVIIDIKPVEVLNCSSIFTSRAVQKSV